MSVKTDFTAAEDALAALHASAVGALDPVNNSGFVNSTLAKVAQSASEASAALAGGAGQLDELENRLIFGT
jgi:hypothetical protein